MPNRCNDFLKIIIGVTMGETVKFLVALIFTTSTLVLISNILTTVFPYLLKFNLLITLVISSGGVLIFFSLYYKYHRYRPKYPSIDFDYRILEKEITYEYKDKTHMIYKKRYLLKALKNNLGSYHDKYRWTGEGNIKIESAIKGHLFREETARSVWNFYIIDFQKYLKKGDTIETELIWELNDVKNKAIPFFSATIEEPTDFLKFNLSSNPELGIKEAICEISYSIGAKKPFETKEKLLDRNGFVKWEVKNPKLLHHYEMRWIY